jgi:cadherin 23
MTLIRYFKLAAVLTILIEDENDNAPVFRQSSQHATVVENAPPGTVVTRILADDADRNRTLNYTLELSAKRTARSTEENLLHLDPESGELRVASRIDRETTPWLNLTVRATDNGVPPRHSFAQVYVQVNDIALNLEFYRL